MTNDAADGIPPLNDCEDQLDQVAVSATCVKYPDEPDYGALIIGTRKGHYAFLIDMEGANDLVQALRNFISGDVDDMIGTPDDGKSQ